MLRCDGRSACNRALILIDPPPDPPTLYEAHATPPLPECQSCPVGATCTDGLAKCKDPMKTVQNGQCRENKDLARRVAKATEAISDALPPDAGERPSSLRHGREQQAR